MSVSQNHAGGDQLLERLRSGDVEAPTELFNRFARRLLGLARNRLDARLRQKVDPEDIVQSVFRSFFTRHADDQFDVRTEDKLWSLLAMITVRKCTNVRVRFGRQGRNVYLELAQSSTDDETFSGWEALSREPAPEQVALLDSVLEQLIVTLNDRERTIVALHLQGSPALEIADQVGRSERTVQRTIEKLRVLLEEAIAEP